MKKPIIEGLIKLARLIVLITGVHLVLLSVPESDQAIVLLGFFAALKIFVTK